MLSNNDLELALASLLFIMGIWLCRKQLLYLRDLTVLHITILMTAIFFGLGPWVAYFISGHDLPDERRDLIWSAYTAVGLFLLGLAAVPKVLSWFVPSYKPPTLWQSISHLQRVTLQSVLLLYVSLWIVRILVAREYGILFSGTSTSDRLARVPYMIVVVQSILEILATGCFFWACLRVWEGDDWLIRIFSILIILTSFAWSLTQGRRAILTTTAILFYCYSAYSGRFHIKQLLYGIATVVLLMGYIFPTFVRMRMAHDSLGAEEEGIGHMYRTSVGASRVDDQDLQGYYEENMSERPLIIRFIFRILESQSSVEPMQGEAFFNCVLWAIPSAIYSEKAGILNTETLIQRHHYHRIIDTSLTWPATGVADFGIKGGFIIGIFFAIIILATEQVAFMVSSGSPIVAASTLGGLIVPIANVEDDPATIFCLIRALIVLFVLAKTLSWVGVLNAVFFRREPQIEQSEA